MNEIFIAVYGTLKEGNSNYIPFLNPKKPLFRGFVKINYKMYSNEFYPMLVNTYEVHRIFIEVFSIDQNILKLIDTLEEPYLYHRESIKLQDLSQPVEIYVYNFDNPPDDFIVVDSGKW